MSVREVKAVECGCERCGHTWTPRVEEGLPTICPHCKSAYWNKPRVRDAKKKRKE
jgi:predicted Zn-ribbon and HTH transcriptional regulator